MARLHHVTRSMLAQAGALPAVEAGASWRPSRPGSDDPVAPWFSLTPRAPSADTRLGGGRGLVAVLETSGGTTGPAPWPGDPPPVVLGGATVAPGAPAPVAFDGFRHDCTARLTLHASGLRPGRQALVVLGVRTPSTEQRAVVQSFAGLVPIAEDTVHGDDALAFSIDGGDDGKLAVRLVVRLCDTGPTSTLGITGAVGYLL